MCSATFGLSLSPPHVAMACSHDKKRHGGLDACLMQPIFTYIWTRGKLLLLCPAIISCSAICPVFPLPLFMWTEKEEGRKNWLGKLILGTNFRLYSIHKRDIYYLYLLLLPIFLFLFVNVEYHKATASSPCVKPNEGFEVNTETWALGEWFVVILQMSRYWTASLWRRQYFQMDSSDSSSGERLAVQSELFRGVCGFEGDLFERELVTGSCL